MDKTIVERYLGKEQFLGDKIDIIGSFGAGKTTLALQLGETLGIPVFHLDRFFWLPGWKAKPENVRIKILEELVQQEQWIIEGAYLRISKPRLNTADTIIFLDIPDYLCLIRTFLRYFKDREQFCPDLPDRCSRNLTPRRILKVVAFRIRHHKELSQKMRKYESSKNIIWLRSPKEVKNFLAKLQQEVNDKKDAHVPEPATMV
jgi:adenylate kinase family enzyme